MMLTVIFGFKRSPRPRSAVVVCVYPKNPKDYRFQSKSTNCACYCRRPIEERVVTAMGKHWHVEHFACAKCEKPFLGHRHYEKNGLAYCYFHYHQLFGSLCYHCNGVIEVTYNLFKLSLLLFFFREIFSQLLARHGAQAISAVHHVTSLWDLKLNFLRLFIQVKKLHILNSSIG